MNITAVSPHRDDAAFSLGLAIEVWLAAGHAVSVLNCFTKSDYAPYSDVEALHANDRVSFVSALRRREDLAWNKLNGGRVRIYDLDLLDAPLRLGCAVDEVLQVEVRAGDRALARVTGALGKMIRNTPELALVAPLAVGGHIDHRVARQAVLDSTKGTTLPVAFYEDLPYAAREGEAAKLEAEAAAIGAAMKTELQPCFAVGEGLDIEAAVARKRRLANGYDSQIDTGVVDELARFAERYGGRERLWGNPAWCAAENLCVRPAS